MPELSDVQVLSMVDILITPSAVTPLTADFAVVDPVVLLSVQLAVSPRTEASGVSRSVAVLDALGGHATSGVLSIVTGPLA